MKKNRIKFLILLVITGMLFSFGVPINTIPVQAAKKVTISSKKLTLKVGDSVELSLKNTKGTSITWASSKPKIAKVKKTLVGKGEVTALKAGKATITATYKGQTYNCKITVEDSGKSSKELTSKEIYKLCSDSVVEVNAGISLGSGFYIEKKKVVTNYHVIEGATALSVKTMDNNEYDVLKVIGYSKSLDLAVLEVDHAGVPMKKNTHGLTMGETTYTIGSSQGLTNTYSNGMITNTGREIGGMVYIQTNTAISHGNSGGPLINAYGEVIGITTASFTEGQNLNLAINITDLDKLNLDDPISAKDFISGKNGGGMQPDYEALLITGNSMEAYAVALGVINHGTKDMKIGNSALSGEAAIFPSSDSNQYSLVYIVDDEEFFRDDSYNISFVDYMTVKAGEKRSVYFISDTPIVLYSDAYLVYTFLYDGVEYAGISDMEGNTNFQPMSSFDF